MNASYPSTVLDDHVRIVGWLHLVGHALYVALGVFVYVLLGGIGAVSGDPRALVILNIVGSAVAFLFLLLALPGMLAGYGLLTARSWGYPLAMVVGILNLVNFPVGTVLGVYTLWALTRPATAPEAQNVAMPKRELQQPQTTSV